MKIGPDTIDALKIGAHGVKRLYIGAALAWEHAGTLATPGNDGEIVFDPIASLDDWTAAAGSAGEIVATSTSGGTEFLYRLKSAGGDWTRATGSSPITVTSLDAGAVYEFTQGDGTIGEVTAGAGVSEFTFSADVDGIVVSHPSDFTITTTVDGIEMEVV